MSSRTSSNVIGKRRAHSKKNREEKIHESGISESDSSEPGAVPKKPNRKSVKFAKLRKIGTRKPPQERKLCTGRKTRNARIAKVHIDAEVICSQSDAQMIVINLCPNSVTSTLKIAGYGAYAEEFLKSENGERLEEEFTRGFSLERWSEKKTLETLPASVETARSIHVISKVITGAKAAISKAVSFATAEKMKAKQMGKVCAELEKAGLLATTSSLNVDDIDNFQGHPSEVAEVDVLDDVFDTTSNKEPSLDNDGDDILLPQTNSANEDSSILSAIQNCQFAKKGTTFEEKESEESDFDKETIIREILANQGTGEVAGKKKKVQKKRNTRKVTSLASGVAGKKKKVQKKGNTRKVTPLAPSAPMNPLISFSPSTPLSLLSPSTPLSPLSPVTPISPLKANPPPRKFFEYSSYRSDSSDEDFSGNEISFKRVIPKKKFKLI